MESLTLRQAADLYGQLPLPVKPATLHPAYVAADARRDAGLRPVYLAFRRGEACWLHGLHVASVAGTAWQDASSPYGYGGPVSSSDDPGFLAAAWSAYRQWMRAERVVVEYIRFHPLLANERWYGGAVADNRQVVCMDLAREFGYPPRLRQTLAKAQRAGLRYREAPFAPASARFASLYREAMREIGADPFYLFDDGYFAALGASGLARLGVCTRDGDDEWLAASVLLDGAGAREYHLAATTPQGRQGGAPSMVLHEAAQAARAAGLRHFYLGGGTDRSPGNRLLFFKGAFSPDRMAYRTGSALFDEGGYRALQERFPAAWAAHPEWPIFYRKV